MKQWMRTGAATASLVVASVGAAWAWGKTGHRIINASSTMHLPTAMSGLAAQSAYLGSHASDADSRKSSDPAEKPKHFIDIDAYPEFRAGTLSHSYDALVAKYGAAVVIDRGTVPWTVGAVKTQLSAAMRSGDWPKAYLLAADLGHYVGDSGQPMHATENFDGQLTGNRGIHSRYESSMVDRHEAELQPVVGQAVYLPDPVEAMFTLLGESNAGVDSVMAADNTAKVLDSGYGTVYYDELWRLTGAMTKRRVQRSSEMLASLLYTAWVNAGQPPVPGTTAVALGDAANELTRSFRLQQNEPNPFNPTTEITFDLPRTADVTLVVFDATGREVARPVVGTVLAGHHHVAFDGTGLPTGVYLYRLTTADGLVQSRRMLLLR